MSKIGIDPRRREELNRALLDVDKIVMHKYISEIDKRPVLQQAFDVSFSIPDKVSELPWYIVGENIRLLKLTRFVYDKDENFIEKLTTAYNATALVESATIVLLLKCNKSRVDFYWGTVNKKCDDDFVLNKQIKALNKNLQACFPGSQFEEISESDECINIVQEIYKNTVNIASVTGIAALKENTEKDNSKYTQGVEKLIEALKGQTCSVLIIADPVSNTERDSIRAGYEELYTSIMPFEKADFSVNSTNGKAITDSIVKGVTDTVSDSIAKTKTHTLTKGTNSSHTVGGSTSIGTSTSVSVGAHIGVPGAGANVGVSQTVSANVSADYHYMHGQHKDVSDTSGETNTSGTSKSLSEQNSVANSVSSSNGEGLQISYENRSIKSILDRIDKQIKRIEECEDYGMYDCGVYFLSNDYSTCLFAASTYRSLIQGDSSSVEASQINIWDADSAKSLVPYLSTFNHPIFDISDNEEKHTPVSASTLISGKELPIYMGVPKKSIAGVPVVQCASFGREVQYSDKQLNSGETIQLGIIHHMHSDETLPVLLDKNSMTSHAFITGSTGSGKSNVIYQLIKKTCLCLSKDAPHFMVIEPAKGEYKNVFGGYNGVTVYGTNIRKGNLLRINPFSFPDDIHVLEHIDRLIELFNVCWPMYAAMPAVLKSAVERAYLRCGWDLELSQCIYGKKYPSFADVLTEINNVILESAYSSDSKGDYVGALSTRVSSLTNGINGQILNNDEISNTELFDQNVIVDLSRVGSTETKSLLMGLLIIKLQEYRMSTEKGSNKVLSHLTVLEEAHNLLKRTSTEQSAESSNLVGKSVEMLANAIAEMRTYGEGFVIVDQSPGLMDMSVIRNTNTKMILRLPDMSDRELVGRAAGLNNDQIEELAKLETGVAAVYQNNWVEPVLCHIDKWDESKNKPQKIEEQDNANGEREESLKTVIRYILHSLGSLEKERNSLLSKPGISSSLKLKVERLFGNDDDESKNELKRSIIYELFNPGSVLDANYQYRNNVDEWYLNMVEQLHPSIKEEGEIDIRIILAILAAEKYRIDQQEEYLKLVDSMISYSRGTML